MSVPSPHGAPPLSIRRQRLLTNRDALLNADRAKVTRKCVTLFDSMQFKRDKESNLLALACAFILATSSMKVPAQDAFTAA